MLEKQDNTRQFLYKKSYMKRRLQHDVVENGIAYIPCKVSGMEDIISKFSVKGCESLDSVFMTYITDFIKFVPVEYPVTLEISGAQFSDEEKKIITETITSDMDYNLGKTEEEHLKKKKRFWAMIIGTIAAGILLPIAKQVLPLFPLELYYVLFWLFADAWVRYQFIEKSDYKEEKIQAGRLASLKVEFTENGQQAENAEKRE